MERVEIRESVCVAVPKKLEQHGSVGFTKRPDNTVLRRHHQERAKKKENWKKKKENWTKKRRSRRYKPKPDEVKEMVVDAGSMESLAQPPREGNSHQKPKLDKVKKTVVDAESMQDSMAQPTVEGKGKKRLATQEFVDYIVSVELVDYMLCAPLRKFTRPQVTKFQFTKDYARTSALLNGPRKFEADVLWQYRTNKTEFLTNE